jgi:hypothetical protein
VPDLCESPRRDVAAVHRDRRHALATADGEVGPGLAYLGATTLAQEPADLAYRHIPSLVDIDATCLLWVATTRGPTSGGEVCTRRERRRRCASGYFLLTLSWGLSASEYLAHQKGASRGFGRLYQGDGP